MAHSFQPVPANVTFQKRKNDVYKNKNHNLDIPSSFIPFIKNNKCNQSIHRAISISTEDINNEWFKTTNLISNLYTKENLKGVCVVQNTLNNSCSPNIHVIDATTSKTNPLYYNYVIDPKGQLFGSTPCGLNNYVNFMKPSLQGSTL
jgi:hypothetical protein